MPRRCIKCWVYERNVGEAISFHRIPLGKKGDQWLKILNMSRIEPAPKSAFLCSNHFCKKDLVITPSGIRALRKNAIPIPDLSPFPSAREHETTQPYIDVEKTVPNSVPSSCSELAASNIGKQSCSRDSGLQEDSAAVLNTATATLNVCSGQFKTEDIGLEPGQKVLVLQKGAVPSNPVSLPFSVLQHSINASVYSDLRSEDIGLPPGGKVVVLKNVNVPPAEVPDRADRCEEPSVEEEPTLSSDESTLEPPLDEVPNYDSDLKEIRDLNIEVKSSGGHQTTVISCDMDISEVSKLVANNIWPALQDKPLNTMQNQRQYGDVSDAGTSGNSKPANKPPAKVSQGLIKTFSDIQYEDMEDPETRKMCWKIIKATVEKNRNVIKNLQTNKLRKKYQIDTLKSRKES